MPNNGLGNEEFWQTVKAEAHVSGVTINQELRDVPYLIEQRGRIVGLGFEPGKPFLRIKTTDVNEAEVTYAATQSLVDQALELRDQEIRVLGLITGAGRKALRVQGLGDSQVRLDLEAYVFAKWQSVIERLAQ